MDRFREGEPQEKIWGKVVRNGEGRYSWILGWETALTSTKEKENGDEVGLRKFWVVEMGVGLDKVTIKMCAFRWSSYSNPFVKSWQTHNRRSWISLNSVSTLFLCVRKASAFVLTSALSQTKNPQPQNPNPNPKNSQHQPLILRISSSQRETQIP